MIKMVKIQVSSDKDSNYELGKTLGFVPGSEQERRFASLASEVTLFYEVNIKTGDAKIVGFTTREGIGYINE
jgi:hypothetical protein